MAVQIKFDQQHNPIASTLVLATRQGRKLGKIPATGIDFKDNMKNGHEMTFKVTSEECGELWDKIVDFKLVWARDWDRWFEIYVDTDDTEYLTKNVTAKSLGVAELSQINLYGRQINTEDDIARDDYEPTVFYNEKKPGASLLHRLLDKAPHYKIGHVDTSLMTIQRTFTFDNKSIYDALQDVAEEMECLITVDCISDEHGRILRQVNAYDLKSYCLECAERGDFTDKCSKCGSENIKHGYGKDTTIFVSTENLADNIKYSTDNGSVKNCFKLEAGDDLMTAAIVSCNPNGSAYIWHITDDMKEDMSEALWKKLDDYDALYAYYQAEHTTTIPDALLTAYNAIVEKYSKFTSDYKKAAKNIVGYPALMQKYFDAIDLELYLKDKLMPDRSMEDTTAAKQLALIMEALKDGVAVKNIKTCSATTAENAVLGLAKAVSDSRYKITISNSIYNEKTWSGIVSVTNNSDDEDTATSSRVSCKIGDDYAGYIKQNIFKTIGRTEEDASSVDALLKLDDGKFQVELGKYCLSRLSAFRDVCQSCVDLLIQHGLSDKSKYAKLDDDLYQSIYLPYYNKLKTIEQVIQVREQEIATVSGKYDTDGKLLENGMKSFIEGELSTIQKNLNFDGYLGKDLLMEFSAYRREDTFRNNNYISDGLNNTELFQMAQRFLNVARFEILKSATLQHKISAQMKNLLGMKEFEPIVQYFEIGNWIRVRTDGKLFRLRLIEYEINFDDFNSINVEFSDVVTAGDTASDLESILNQASSMATSYETVARQAKDGKASNARLADWVDRGLALTKMRIIDSADEQNISWDKHGLLAKEYLPVMGTYDDRQLKIINRGLYLTDDNWETSKAGIGDFTYWNPKTGQMEEAYGVIADTIVGNLILSKEVGIYNMANSISMDENGLTITSFNDGESSPVVFNVRKRTIDEDGNEHYSDEMYLDADGNLVINGAVRINSSSTPGEQKSIDKAFNDIQQDVSGITKRIDGFNGLFFYIRYSANKDGSNMTEAPDANTVYMGTCNTDEKTAPTDPKRYIWTKVKGETGKQGIQGIQGVDGTSHYLHIRYSNDGGNTFTDNGGTAIGDWIGTAVTESDTAPTAVKDYSWSRFNGIDGINTASISLYKRFEILPDGKNGITAALTYTFATQELSGDLNGWSTTFPPSNGKACYVIKAVAASREAKDVIQASEWSKPVKFVEDGVAGNDGYNTATVYLYKRSEDTNVTVDWRNELTYSFTLSKLTSVPTGWSMTIPSGDAPLYVTAATVASTTKTDTVAYTEWSAPVMLSKNGKDGGKGVDGLNSATIFLYCRSGSKPNKPTVDATYTFKTGTLSEVPNWSTSVPAGASPCYVVHATAVANTDSDTILKSEWSDPVVLVQDGAKGKDGTDGKDGSNGADGHNTAMVYLYQRASSAPAISWTNDLTYTFSTKKLTSVPSGWSQTIPSGTNPLYVTIANAYSDTDTDSIAYSEWCAPVVLAKDGNNGTTYYTWLKYADSPTSGMSDSPDGKKYIGIAYNKTSKTESTNYSDYTWSLIKGSDGVNGINGKDGKTYYTWIRYAQDSNGTGMTSDPDGMDYIGVAYNKTSSTPSNNASDYSWSLFKGSDGIDGKDGANGVSSYFHIRYSAKSDGSSMSSTPTSTTVYIGVCSTTSPTAPTDVKAYKWSKIRGDNGTPGAKGADGKTQYLHIKYSDDGETFTANNGEDLGDWIGTLVDFNQADSNTFKDYKWRRFSDDLSEVLVDMENVKQRVSDFQTSIETTCDRIVMSALEQYSDSGDLYELKGMVRTQLEALAGEISMKFESATSRIDNMDGEISDKFQQLSKYIKYTSDTAITIGSGDSKITLEIDNEDGITFKKDGEAFGKWDGDYFETGNIKINVNERAQFGNFAFVPRSDSSLMFLKVGG